MEAPLVTVVVPAYKEAARLPAMLSDVVASDLQPVVARVEWIVIDDGSPAEQVERERAAVEEASRAFAAAHAPHRIAFHQAPRNRGKAAAIRLGWSLADPQTTWLAFIDADGAVPGREFWRLAQLAGREPGLDVLAGSRVAMAGRDIGRKLSRHLQGRIFATIAERLLHLGFYDTQCGLKLFRASSLRPVLPLLNEERWLLDLEILAYMKARGATMREEPIDWHEPGGSKMIPGVDAARMAWGILRLRNRMRSFPASESAAGRERAAR